MGRFLCRVKEITKQVTSCLPKGKMQLLILTKKIEMLTLKVVTFENAAVIITSLLQMISNPSLALCNIPLKIKGVSKTLQKQRINQSPEHSVMLQYVSKDTIKSAYESEIMLGHTDKYDVIDIDRQHFRGRYFDLKENELSAVNEQAARNKTISQIIANYEKQYVRHQNKNSYSSEKYSHQKNINPISWEIRTIESQSSNLLQKSPKRVKQSRSVNSSRNQITKTINSNKSEIINEISTQRNLYEEKRLQRSKCGVKMTTFTLNEKGKAVQLQGANMQRWRFFKKSQEHLKYRYKYLYQSRHISSTSHSFKSKTINPELLNTINHG